jgi:cytolysin (calcineurin-like family phosphatase)
MSYAGAIGGLIVLDRPLTWREVRNHIGMFDAFGAAPADGTTLPPGEVMLRWQSGRAGARPVIRISEGGAAPASQQPRPGATSDEWEFGPVKLGIGRELVWQVDQTHAADRDEGPQWRVRGDSGPATTPVPRDRVTGVDAQLAVLSWKPGPHASAQSLFFGEREQEVLTAATAVAKLAASATSFSLPAALKPGTRYFWRVATDNGPHPPDPGTLWTFRTADAPVKNDLTFIVATDQHYGRDNNKDINHMVVGLINNVAGTPYPESFGGGFVRTPLGVIAPGDLLDKGYDPKESAHKWDEWVADFGLTGKDGHLVFPVYEGIGNHDGGPTRSIPRAKIRERNKIRPGLTSVSPNGLHYSWDWQHVHFVQVNLFPGDTPADATVGPAEHDPEMALEFLRNDLAKHVGDTGKPVVIIQHYGILGGMSDWWTPESKERYYQAIEKYNIIGIFCGHSHGNEILPWKNFLHIHCGSTARPEYGTGDFVVVHITETEMRIAQRKPDSWGVTKKVPIKTPV